MTKTLRPEQLPVDGKLITEATNLEGVSGKVAATKLSTTQPKITKQQRMLHPKNKEKKAKTKRRSS